MAPYFIAGRLITNISFFSLSRAADDDDEKTLQVKTKPFQWS